MSGELDKIDNAVTESIILLGINPDHNRLSETLDSLHRLFIVEQIERQFDVNLTEMLTGNKHWSDKSSIVNYVESKVKNK